MITTVLLDLDDTILDFHKAEKGSAEKKHCKKLEWSQQKNCWRGTVRSIRHNGKS